MQNDPLILTFDLGTQSTRAMLVDTRGEIRAMEKVVYPRAYFSHRPGWAEQKPEVYRQAIRDAAHGVRASAGVQWGQVIAVTTTCIRGSYICLDKAGEPVRDIILWLDKRTSEGLPPMPAKNRMAFKLAGVSRAVEAIRNNCACNWVRHHEPDSWAKTHKFALLSGWLNHLFCGNLVDSVANTIGALPFDAKYGDWVDARDIRRAIFDIERDKLVDLVKPGTVIGAVTQRAADATGIPAGTPYVVTGSDKGCETLCLTCHAPDSAALSFGTTATVQVTSPRYFQPLPVIPPYPAVAGGYNPEVETYRGYWLISWFKREFAAKEVQEAEALGTSAEALLDARMNEVPPGCEGLMLQPTFTPDDVTPFAKGAVIGFSDVHTRIHLYRAIVEGINYSLMEGLGRIEKKGKLKVGRLFVAGGGSRSDAICQITADMFGLPVGRIQTHESSGLGSSLVGFVGMGVFGSLGQGAQAMVHVRDTFQPDRAHHRTYRALYEQVYCRIFDTLTPMYKRIDDILGNGGA